MFKAVYHGVDTYKTCLKAEYHGVDTYKTCLKAKYHGVDTCKTCLKQNTKFGYLLNIFGVKFGEN